MFDITTETETTERTRVISCLVAAFTRDPFIRWMFPDPEQFLHAFPLVLQHFAGGAFEHGSAHRSADYRAAALWLPPGVGPDEEALGKVMDDWLSADMKGDVFDVLEQVGGGHPEETHWYLPAMGVDPILQGRGCGSALLARGLEVIDQDKILAYLESTNPANIPLYRRFGFEVIGEIQSGNSPVITRMLRTPR